MVRRPRVADPRPTLSQDAIVGVALRIISTEGIAAVSMRRIAEHFGTGPASLYAHVESREDLLLLAYDAVAAKIPLPTPDPKRWREQLVELLTVARQVLTAHGDIAAMGIGRVPTQPRALDTAESMLALLAFSGMPEKDIALAADLLPLYLTAVAYEEGLATIGIAEESEAYFGRVHERWRTLPADRYPTIVAMSPTLFSAGDGDERFQFGLEVLLNGLLTKSRTC